MENIKYIADNMKNLPCNLQNLLLDLSGNNLV